MIDFHAIAQASKASQDKTELEELLYTVDEISPKNIVEIGAWKGYSAETFIKAFSPDSMICLEKESKESLLPVMELQELGGIGFQMWFNSDSHDPDVLKTLKIYISQIDFLFIDGNHMYDSVKKDFELYSPLVRKGGIVAFHDARITDNDTVEVYKFWNEIKHQYKHKEIFSSMGTGTGVIWL